MGISELITRLRSRARDEEDGFALLEIVVAMGIIFVALTLLIYTAMVGFKDAGLARQRQVATAIADKLVEETRGLPWTTIQHGLSDSDLSGDSNIVQCGSAYDFQTCAGEPIVHTPGLPNATPLAPHRS